MTEENKDHHAELAAGDSDTTVVQTPQLPHNAPVRIQRKRSKGWKMPPNTIYVGRPTKFGNPWSPVGYWNAGYSGDYTVAAAACVEQYRAWITHTRSSWSGDIPEAPWSLPGVPESGRKVPALHELRGKNLACWCPIGQPCHADVLLELANS